jgi:hypothetical protein
VSKRAVFRSAYRFDSSVVIYIESELARGRRWTMA